jgi:murein DD-endopeptidase MepM/ murein hydrolase activator NlpD
MIDFSAFRFYPVIRLPAQYEVFDFTQGYDPARSLASGFGIGRYDENRRGMYNSELFRDGPAESARTIHVGIDIAAPAGFPVQAFFAGEIFLTGYNGADGDYGYTVITRHELGGEPLYALHGHLSRRSVEENAPGRIFAAGETIAWLGERHENGGWNPHLHFQLCLVKPEKCDLPGAVSPSQREAALKIYPDPRLVLGPLY